ncbi:MAG TPA: DUF2914 domain-containing protein [Nitrospiria bacterium]|nr:DUF2914 domain-containing protein [Nitrospiria bacterium]
MLRGLFLILPLFLSLSLQSAGAEEKAVPAKGLSEKTVVEGYISTDAIKIARGPEKTGPVIDNTAGRIHAITKLNARGADPMRIKHIWFLRDQIIYEATLSMKPGELYARSGFTLKPTWVGKWRVDVTAEDGTLLYSIPFSVRKNQESITATASPSQEGPSAQPASGPAIRHDPDSH